jgi:hypothetical protein
VPFLTRARDAFLRIQIRSLLQENLINKDYLKREDGCARNTIRATLGSVAQTVQVEKMEKLLHQARLALCQ